jgi:fucose permease
MVRNRSIVLLVMITFFVISLLTNILGPIVPDIISSFQLSLTAAALLAFAFFIAYGVMSIPAGFLVERLSEKPVMILGFLAGMLGSLTFAAFPRYDVAVVSYFVIGAGMAVLQVAINPLLRVAGGEEHYAFHSALAQFVFGSASFLSPWIYSYLVVNLSTPSQSRSLLVAFLERVTPAGLPWASIYWVFATSALVMIVILAVCRFPRVQHTVEESAGSLQIYGILARNPLVWMYFVAMLAYVGCEQGTADWISKFLSQYHGFDPHTSGAAVVSWFWGLMTAGCAVGMLLLKIFDSRRVLIGTSVGALLSLSAALFGPASVSVCAFPIIGLFASVMWPIVISLALNSVAEYHGSFAGILGAGMGIGGAVVPVIIGRIGDHLGLRSGMTFLYVMFGVVLSTGFWAKPLVSNAVIDFKRSAAQPAEIVGKQQLKI